MQRYLPDVIDKMIAEIPKEETEIITYLERCLDSARYAAPEVMSVWWDEVADILDDNLPSPAKCNEWQTKITSIFTNEPTPTETKE